MIQNIRVHDRGVSVSVDIEPGTWRVTERFGNDAEVDVRSAGTTFYKIPNHTATLDVMARGLQYRKDGTLGTRQRSHVMVYDEDVPDEVRKALVNAAQEAFHGRTS